MNNSPDILLEIRNLLIEIKERKIVECANFTIARRDKILLTAASGGGKTIFLRCLSGLLDAEYIKTGTFVFHMNGKRFEVGYKEFVRRQPLTKNTTFIFQDAMNSLHPYRSINDQIDVITSGDDVRKSEILQEFGLQKKFSGQGERFFSRLSSGGECQRVSLMHIHSAQKNLLLMDEPLTDIDRISRFEIENQLKKLFSTESSFTSVLVTHDTDWIEEDCHINDMRHFTISDTVLSEMDTDGKRIWRKARHQNWESAGADKTDKRDAGSEVLAMQIVKPFGFTGRSNYQLWKSPRLHVGHGEIVGLLGESGSGKSVILRCMAGLQSRAILNNVKREIAELGDKRCHPGELIMSDVSNTPTHKLAHSIQYVFQNNKASVIGTRTIYDDLAEIKMLALEHTMKEFSLYCSLSVNVEDVKQAMDDIIEQYWKDHFHISADTWDDQKHKDVSALSLGMLRRYNILRALIKLGFYTGVDVEGGSVFDQLPDEVRCRPRILLADEISRGLDQTSLIALIELLKNLKEKIGLSIVLVSHELRFIQALADRVFVVVDGFVMPTPLTGDLSILAATVNPYYGIYSKALDRNKTQLVIMESRILLEPPPRTQTGCVVHAMLLDGCPRFKVDSDCIAGELAEGNTARYGVCD